MPTGICDVFLAKEIRFSGTTINQTKVLSITDDRAIGDPDLKDYLGAQTALSGADATTITAAVKTASGFGTRTVTAT